METEVESMVTVPILILQSSVSHLLNQYLLPVKNHSLQLSPPTSALQQISSGPAPSLMTPGYISSGLVQISVSPTPYVPPCWEIQVKRSKYCYMKDRSTASQRLKLLIHVWRHLSSTTNVSKMNNLLSTSPTNQEIQSLKGFHHSVDKESLLEIVFGDSFSSNFSHKSQLRDMPFGATLTQNENPTHYVWKRLMVEIYYLNDSLWCQNNFVQDPCAQCMAPDQSSQTRAS
ncbi:hypothetical protein Tco_0970252 [Tanacetum coccineum]